MFGVAVLASVFSRYGGYESGQTFVDGMTPALWIGAVVVGLGAVAAFAIPAVRTRRATRDGSALAGDRRGLILDRVARVATDECVATRAIAASVRLCREPSCT